MVFSHRFNIKFKITHVMYLVQRPSRSEFVPIRNHQYHVHIWGTPSPNLPPLVMVHGWMDVGASFQFVVDALKQDRYVIAPDWRGYGHTTGPATDNYWFPDYMADLDFLLDHYTQDQSVDLLGHSMGGNVAMVYTGVRPARIRRLINLEGFGMPTTVPAQAPGRYAKWMDELKAFGKGDMALRPYPDASGVARRLMKTNPRLSADKAHWLAQHWAAPNSDGQWQILGDAAHKITNAQLYRVEEVLACYTRITAPVLNVEAADDSLTGWYKGTFTLSQYHERLLTVPNVRTHTVQDAGHMMHHDQPQVLAALIEEFLGT
jgi:pimeloyl-ACP methyl ester carboxylesterase